MKTVSGDASSIAAKTLRAYRETHYLIRSEPDVLLRIGEASSALAALHRRHGVDASALVTAWNPCGVLLDAVANARRQALLEAALAAGGTAFLPGIGRHPTGDWPGEESVLALGLDRAAAAALGRRFAQNAVVWSGHDAVPGLLVLR